MLIIMKLLMRTLINDDSQHSVRNLDRVWFNKQEAHTLTHVIIETVIWQTAISQELPLFDEGKMGHNMS